MSKNTIEEKKRKSFRVSIFGSARIPEDDIVYKQTFELAKVLGENGIDVVTGGGPGIMQAANQGHMTGNKKGDTESIGLTVTLPYEKQQNKYLNIHEHFEHFSGRLDEFMNLSNVVVVMPGGIGTCLELFYSWQLIQVGHVKPMPIILMGDVWPSLITWMEEYLLKRNRMKPKDMEFVYMTDDIEKTFQFIEHIHEHFHADQENYCNTIQKL